MKITGFHVQTTEFQYERPLASNGNPDVSQLLFATRQWKQQSLEEINN